MGFEYKTLHEEENIHPHMSSVVMFCVIFFPLPVVILLPDEFPNALQQDAPVAQRPGTQHGRHGAY